MEGGYRRWGRIATSFVTPHLTLDAFFSVLRTGRCLPSLNWERRRFLLPCTENAEMEHVLPFCNEIRDTNVGRNGSTELDGHCRGWGKADVPYELIFQSIFTFYCAYV